MTTVWRTFWRDESAQDLDRGRLPGGLDWLELGLALVGIATLIGQRYTDYNTDVQAASATTPDP